MCIFTENYFYAKIYHGDKLPDEDYDDLFWGI